ncbi:copper-fist-domain-containing protein [Neoconidiobolus thromboides FSU 785]|nr:copper-fist-domain-containing protein [Neoconidiobolus thromboides FSU 785]
MVVINGIKFSCATCIKGHRASTCQHSDRPQIEIRKKGRPITQCAHCRELRKTKKLHIKCICAERAQLGKN